MIRIVSILCICCLLIFSCSSDDNSRIVKDLKDARALWQSHNIKNYQWNENLGCFCGGVLNRDVFVLNGEKDRVEFDESQLFEGYTYEDVLRDSKTIEEAFDFIEELSTKELSFLEIEYDSQYGFPTLINIDYIKDAVDDEIAYVYSNFAEN